MKFDQELLFGIYKLKEISSVIDSVPTAEKANDGMFVFTREGELSVVSGSNEWVMAYTGKYRIEDDLLLIDVKACVVREFEGKTIQRRILKLDGKNLVLDAGGSNSSKKTHLTWVKIQNSL